MVKRGPDGKFQSGGSIVHRAVANQTPDAAGTDAPLYTFQAPDTDRTVVGTLLATPGRPAEAVNGEKRNLAELSFDANPLLIVDDGSNLSDDTRASVLHAAGVVGNADASTENAFAQGSVAGQNAEWRRGTELFLHSHQDLDTPQAVRAIVWYTEG